ARDRSLGRQGALEQQHVEAVSEHAEERLAELLVKKPRRRELQDGVALSHQIPTTLMVGAASRAWGLGLGNGRSAATPLSVRPVTVRTYESCPTTRTPAANRVPSMSDSGTTFPRSGSPPMGSCV